MAAVRGPYVADMYGWFADEEAIWLVLELCEGGDLFKTMMLHGGRLDEHYVCVEVRGPGGGVGARGLAGLWGPGFL